MADIKFMGRKDGVFVTQDTDGALPVAVCPSDDDHWWDYETVSWSLKRGRFGVQTIGKVSCEHGEWEVPVSRVHPTHAQLMFMECDGVSETTCPEACDAEPDGLCEHGHRAWTRLALQFA